MYLVQRFLPRNKVISSWLFVSKRCFYIKPPLFSNEGDEKSKVPKSLSRRTKLSPEDRMKSMLENISDGEVTKDTKSEVAAENNDKDNIPLKKWKFGRRRSISPLSRVQGMLDDLEDKK